MSLDVDDYRLNNESLAQIKPKRPPKRKSRRSARNLDYLRGPIPGDWLSIAGNLPGKTLHVALAIWLAYGVVKDPRFRFTPKWYAWFDVGPHTLRRSLRRLRDAGLIRIEHRKGCSPIVTLLDAPEGSVDE
jgi:hypothetical protein